MKSHYIYDKNIVNRVLIVGLGKTGESVYHYLKRFAVGIDIYDINGRKQSSMAVISNWSDLDLMRYDLIVVSPGIPINQAPYLQLLNDWDKVVCDIDLFYQAIKSHSTKLIAITGSNGKSTTVTLIHDIIKAEGYKVALVGNIGVPVLSKLDDDYDFYVLELSSFQLDLIKMARFGVGCILNISEDHLDRYEDFNAYRRSKLSLINRCDRIIVNQKDKIETQMSNGIFFNNALNFIDEYGNVCIDRERVINAGQLKLQGRHNLINIMAVLLIVDYLNLNRSKACAVIANFMSLAHRCELVAKIDGVFFINDSKATNIGATIAAVEGLGDVKKKNITLLLGGVHKEADFKALCPMLNRFVKAVCIYGQDGFKIKQMLQFCFSKLTLHENLNQAFDAAVVAISRGDIVLLAPACASFDAYSGFVQRGEHFIELVHQRQEYVDEFDLRKSNENK
ncbi:MAG: UDP-N-acetylmuramoyl-L-alanine--D-glutamate ligase [Francisellaceae bacterium]